MKPPSNNLPEHNYAIASYLDDMLREATNGSSIVGSVATVALGDKSLLLPELLLPAIEEQISTVENAGETDSLIVDIPGSNSEVLDTQHQFHPDVEVHSEFTSLEADDFPLPCLMFKVADTLLSMPLIQMHGVLPWPDNISRLPQSPDWMFGLIKYRGQNIRLVDSAKVFCIPNSTEKLPAHILVLGETGWAISSDQLDKVVTLNYEDVHWHANSDNLVSVGTIRDSLAMLLNLSGIENSLNKSVPG